MSFWADVLSEAQAHHTFWIVGAWALSRALLRLTGAGDPRRARAVTFVVLVHALLVPAVAYLRPRSAMAARDALLALLIFGTIAIVGIAAAVVFAVLPRLRVRPPRILQDVLVAAASLVSVFWVAARADYNLTGVLTTSAILTAVVGFALQDTLGNIAGGLALQLDSSIALGDWIKVGDLSGRVTEINWRYTAVETRNWETAVIPNSVLMRNQVMALGRRSQKPLQLRRWVWFNVDYRHPPSEVIRVVTETLSTAEIENMATDPPPNCVLMDLDQSSGRYAVRYWLTDLAVDDLTDSKVRTRVFFALQRTGIALSLPAQTVFLSQDTTERHAFSREQDFAHRLKAIQCVELFSHLSSDDQTYFAENLRYAPFLAGEVMTRQGAEAHWLYIVTHGRASIRVAAGAGLVREVSQIKDGDFFGEMSLVTGEPRAATVVALTDTDCFRLDRNAFQTVFRARPELAEGVARAIARRRVELLAAKDQLDEAAKQKQLQSMQTDLLHRIRTFLGLGTPH